ncbi:hypothetical protein PoB_003099200 [Plakobranchus ocellatus]|uniref:Uncharacterized protein n=1 Tax=Plakobranchus ocellatus TaxID=259542 RepID=A0AAV4ABT0_9GAST|nr:hypothetical protein PoB_003099200 [Plakobranchus ocellatus]
MTSRRLQGLMELYPFLTHKLSESSVDGDLERNPEASKPYMGDTIPEESEDLEETILEEGNVTYQVVIQDKQEEKEVKKEARETDMQQDKDIERQQKIKERQKQQCKEEINEKQQQVLKTYFIYKLIEEVSICKLIEVFQSFGSLRYRHLYTFYSSKCGNIRPNVISIPICIVIMHAHALPGGVGGTVASESALRSAGTLLSRVRAPPPGPGLTEGLKA